MVEGVCSSSAAKSDNSFELFSLWDNFKEINYVSETSFSPRIEVELYLFEPELSLKWLFIDSEAEDLVETGSSCTEWVGNNN